MPTIIIGIILFGAMGAAVWYIVRQKKKGAGCGCGCSGCSQKNSCHHK